MGKIVLLFLQIHTQTHTHTHSQHRQEPTFPRRSPPAHYVLSQKPCGRLMLLPLLCSSLEPTPQTHSECRPRRPPLPLRPPTRARLSSARPLGTRWGSPPPPGRSWTMFFLPWVKFSHPGIPKSSTVLCYEPSARSRSRWPTRLQVHRMSQAPPVVPPPSFCPAQPQPASLRDSCSGRHGETLPAVSSPSSLVALSLVCSPHASTLLPAPQNRSCLHKCVCVLLYEPPPHYFSLMLLWKASELWQVRVSFCNLIGRFAEQGEVLDFLFPLRVFATLTLEVLCQSSAIQSERFLLFLLTCPGLVSCQCPHFPLCL